LVFHEVQADLEAAGYEVWPYVLPAASVGAPHRRDRVWFVAYAKLYANGLRTEGGMDLGGELLERPKREEKTNGLNNISKNERPTPNPNRNGLNQRNGNDEEQPGEGGEYAQHHIKPITIDSECIGRVKEWNDNGFFETAQQAKCREQQFSGADSAQSWWRNFPTQPPICTRNDGLSIQLDNITFSKWRNESIKAAGNAIVPQVVLQIFKAIEQYDKNI